ncbi:MAG: hypothetical protein ACK5NT_08035 [Pyrinomonadaceae bacterium]
MAWHPFSNEFKSAAVTSAESNNDLSALGTFMHAQQDSFSHEGFGPKLGQVAAITDNVGVLSSYESQLKEMEKYDKTTYDSAKAVRMARDTLSKLLTIRNIYEKSGKVGVSSSVDINNPELLKLLDKWAKTEGRDEKKKVFG